MITAHHGGLSFSAETPIDLDPMAASWAVNAGLSAGQAFFNGHYATLEGYLADRGSESAKTAQMATIAALAGLWNIARFLNEATSKRIATFDVDLPTPDHFVYQSFIHNDVIWSTYAPTLCASVRSLRAALPSVNAGPSEPPPKEPQAPQKIEIVGMPEQQTVITSMPEQPRPLRARQTVEHHPNTQEITATVTTYEYADAGRDDDA